MQNKKCGVEGIVQASRSLNWLTERSCSGMGMWIEQGTGEILKGLYTRKWKARGNEADRGKDGSMVLSVCVMIG